MKKLIAAAVATSVSAIALADVSITGNANYEYFAKEDTTGFKTNYADTEVNLSVKGKSGDTSVVANIEIDKSSDTATESIDVEDLYLTTKVGDFTIKAGDYASSTTALAGEIEEGSRSKNKVTIGTKIGDASVSYAVASESESNDVYNTDSSSVSVSMPIAGITFQAKENTDTATYLGAKGSVAGVDFRIEQKDADAANSDVLFYQVGTKIGALNVSYAAIDADAGNLVDESDSPIFAQEMGLGSNDAYVDGVNQITLSTDIDGTTVTARLGELTGIAGKQDASFSQIAAKRKLASGATINVSYDDYESVNIGTTGTMTDTQVLEVDLSIAF